MQELAAWASSRSAESHSSDWAKAVRRLLLRTVPISLIGPASTMIGRR